MPPSQQKTILTPVPWPVPQGTGSAVIGASQAYSPSGVGWTNAQGFDIYVMGTIIPGEVTVYLSNIIMRVLWSYHYQPSEGEGHAFATP
jgi:hypothetical protein